MLLYLTIAILFAYTLILIGFFMGWCTLIPTRCHSRRGLPFSTVKSPRRNTKFIEIDSVSSSQSLEHLRHLPERDRKWSNGSGEKKHSLPTDSSKKISDYLHPKYSLPPITIDVLERKWEYESLLRIPGKAVRCSSQDPPTAGIPTVTITIEQEL